MDLVRVGGLVVERKRCHKGAVANSIGGGDVGCVVER